MMHSQYSNQLFNQHVNNSNKQDFNAQTSSQLQFILKRASVILYDLTVALFGFVNAMIRMFFGK